MRTSIWVAWIRLSDGFTTRPFCFNPHPERTGFPYDAVAAHSRGGGRLRPVLMMLVMWLAAVGRCDDASPPPVVSDPQPGDFVKIRGTLSEDVDCRLLRADNGKTYSLS